MSNKRRLRNPPKFDGEFDIDAWTALVEGLSNQRYAEKYKQYDTLLEELYGIPPEPTIEQIGRELFNYRNDMIPVDSITGRTSSHPSEELIDGMNIPITHNEIFKYLMGRYEPDDRVSANIPIFLQPDGTPGIIKPAPLPGEPIEEEPDVFGEHRNKLQEELNKLRYPLDSLEQPLSDLEFQLDNPPFVPTGYMLPEVDVYPNDSPLDSIVQPPVSPLDSIVQPPVSPLAPDSTLQQPADTAFQWTGYRLPEVDVYPSDLPNDSIRLKPATTSDTLQAPSSLESSKSKIQAINDSIVPTGNPIIDSIQQDSIKKVIDTIPSLQGKTFANDTTLNPTGYVLPEVDIYPSQDSYSTPVGEDGVPMPFGSGYIPNSFSSNKDNSIGISNKSNSSHIKESYTPKSESKQEPESKSSNTISPELYELMQKVYNADPTTNAYTPKSESKQEADTVVPKYSLKKPITTSPLSKELQSLSHTTDNITPQHHKQSVDRYNRVASDPKSKYFEPFFPQDVDKETVAKNNLKELYNSPKADIDAIRENERILNESGNNMDIIKAAPHKSNYIVINKAKQKLTVFDPEGNELFSTNRISTGKSGTDYMARTYVREDNGEIADGEGNMSTGAGLTFVSARWMFKNAPSFTTARRLGRNAKDEGYLSNIPTVIHQGTYDIPFKTNGCVRVNGNDLYEIKKYINVNDEVCILPDDTTKSRFLLRDGSLSFSADSQYGEMREKGKYFSNKGRDKYDWDDMNIYYDRGYNDLQIESKPNNTWDNVHSDRHFRPTNETNFFKNISNSVENVIGNYYTKKNEDLRQYNMKKYITGIEKNKRDVQAEFNMTSTHYNNLAKLAMGIAEQESSFGAHSKARLKTLFPEEVQYLKRNFRQKADGSNDMSANSRGITQIKMEDDNNEMQELYNKYGITVDGVINKPEISALATMLRLAHIYKNEIQGRHFYDEDGNEMDSYDVLLYKWLGKNDQLKINEETGKSKATPDQNRYLRNVKDYMHWFDYSQSKK